MIEKDLDSYKEEVATNQTKVYPKLWTRAISSFCSEYHGGDKNIWTSIDAKIDSVNTGGKILAMLIVILTVFQALNYCFLLYLWEKDPRFCEDEPSDKALVFSLERYTLYSIGGSAIATILFYSILLASARGVLNMHLDLTWFNDCIGSNANKFTAMTFEESVEPILSLLTYQGLMFAVFYIGVLIFFGFKATIKKGQGGQIFRLRPSQVEARGEESEI